MRLRALPISLLVVAVLNACGDDAADPAADANADGGTHPDGADAAVPGLDGGDSCGTAAPVIDPVEFVTSIAIAADGTIFLGAGDGVWRARPPYSAPEQPWIAGVNAFDMGVADDGTLYLNTPNGLLGVAVDAPAGTAPTVLHAPTFDYGLDVQGDGTVHFVEQITTPDQPDRWIVRRRAPGGALEDIAAFDFFIGDVAIDTDGSLLVLGYFGSAGLWRVVLDDAGHETSRALLAMPPSSSRQGVAPDGAGGIYYTFSPEVRHLDPVTGIDTLVSAGNTSFNLATGVARGRGALRCDRLFVAANPMQVLTVP